jgi:hypothetical protein
MLPFVDHWRPRERRYAKQHRWVVPYWSSHLDGAKSELIVPGPHGSFNLPQTIAELQRILQLHLRASGASRTALAKTSY